MCEPIQNKPLWLNKLVRLNKAVLYNEEFVNAGIVDYGHLINLAGEILDYDGVTIKFDIPLNNSFFIEFTILYAALPFCWEDNKNYQLPDNHDHLSAFRSALNITFSTKWVYNCLCEFNMVKPIKQQELWSKDLNIQSVVDWNEIYKINYLCTIETKLRSFQIKLSLRVVATNIQLFGFGLIESQHCKFCNKEPKPFFIFFAHILLVSYIGKMFPLAFPVFLKILFS